MPDKCEIDKCENEGADKKHYCPFQYEILDNDDSEFCNCCDDCQMDCQEHV